MNKYLIRFNKSRGQPGRGSEEHAWRIFENDDHEFIAKDVQINVPSWSETDGSDWNVACIGFIKIINDVVVISEAQNISPKRECGDCTACCQGHLRGDAYGHEFNPSVPCFFFSGKSCSIYSDRPASPCKSFKCEWLANDYLPMWMRPDISKVIVTKTINDGQEWVELNQAGGVMDAKTLSWIMVWAINNKKNIKYQINNAWIYIKNNKE